MSDKLKIAWLCHFSNEEIRSRLPLHPNRKYVDFAPWISATLAELRKIEEIELHVVSPHYGLMRLLHEYCYDGINYHFYCADVPLVHKRWKGIPSLFRPPLFPKYFLNDWIVRRVINRIKPDLVNLHGAENPYYSQAILKLQRYPVFICIQGIYSYPANLERLKGKVPIDHHRIKVEQAIYRSFTFFGARAEYMKQAVLQLNPKAIFVDWQGHGIYVPIVRSDENAIKKYDCVFFARVTKTKGIEDLLQAIRLVKQNRKDVSLLVIGNPDNEEYRKHLINLVKESGLSDNVVFRGAIESLDEVHREVATAKISILPTYADNISGTIIESCLIGIPVIAYHTGLIPTLNDGAERIILLEQGDVQGLATSIELLLADPVKGREMAFKARQRILDIFDNHKRVLSLVENYRFIINEYGQRNGK